MCFCRLRCGACRSELLVAPSCKGRGLCPSCGCKRTTDLAAHIADRVIPRVSVRQWATGVHRPRCNGERRKRSSPMQALNAASGPLSFLSGRVDLQRVALSGHSSGAFNVAAASDRPGVQLVMALAGTRAISPASGLRSVLVMGTIEDKVMPYASGGIGVGSVLYPGSSTDAYNATLAAGGLASAQAISL